MRQFRGLLVEEIRQPELRDDLVHECARPLPAGANQVGQVVPRCLGVRGGEQVLPDGHVREQFDGLERPGEPSPGPADRGPSDDRLLVEQDLARGGLGEAGDDVEQCRLARAVGADEAQDLAGLDAQTHVGQCVHPAETDAEVAHLEYRGLALTGGRRDGGCGFGGCGFGGCGFGGCGFGGRPVRGGGCVRCGPVSPQPCDQRLVALGVELGHAVRGLEEGEDDAAARDEGQPAADVADGVDNLGCDAAGGHGGAGEAARGPADPTDHRIHHDVDGSEHIELREDHGRASEGGEDPTDPTDRGRQAERVELGAVDPDADRCRGPLVAADREQPSPGTAPPDVGHDKTEKHQHDQDKGRVTPRVGDRIEVDTEQTR